MVRGVPGPKIFKAKLAWRLRIFRALANSFIMGHAPRHQENNFSAGGHQVRLPMSCLMACGKTLVRYIDMFKNCGMSARVFVLDFCFSKHYFLTAEYKKRKRLYDCSCFVF